MSRVESETTGLMSKFALKSRRNDYLVSVCLRNGLFINTASFWTEEEKAKEAEIFVEADIYYEDEKIRLKEALLKLSPEELEVYFSEVGVEAQKPEEYLAPSPVT